jgi:adenylate kinase
MANIVVVTGTPGAGKTTMVDSLKEAKGYRCVNVGDLMERLGVERGYVRNRDEMRLMDNFKTTGLRNETFSHISSFEGKVIVDTHATVVNSKRRYIPGFPFEALMLMKTILGFVYVDASSEEIIARRNKDKSRARNVENAAIINDQRTINLAMLSYYSSYLNIPLYVVENKEGHLKEAVAQFKDDVMELFGENK